MNRHSKLGKVAKRIAIVGGGASALFVLNEFVSRNRADMTLDIFEAGNSFGPGMPYSEQGALTEHITNVSCEEISDLVEPVESWLRRQPQATLDSYGIDGSNIDTRNALPRLLFGQYLSDQFLELLKKGERQGLTINIHSKTPIADLIDNPAQNRVGIVRQDGKRQFFDNVIVTTGHVWKQENENRVEGYFDTPYPPRKLTNEFNHCVGLRGSSLTAIDALKTLARAHGQFQKNDRDELVYIPNANTENFKVVMHSRQGLLPCIRFHFDNPRVFRDFYLSQEEIELHALNNNGKVSLNHVFEKTFKEPLATGDPDFYKKIEPMSLEEFAAFVFEQRKSLSPFKFFADELRISRESMKDRKSMPWKETLAFLSSAVNFTAKRMSGEDMLRVRNVLMPLVSHIAAYLPHESCDEILALHEAGKLDIVAVGDHANLSVNPKKAGADYFFKDQSGKRQKVHYDTFVDCIGQRQLSIDDFPFRSLVEQGAVAPAKLEYDRSDKKGVTYLELPGIAIDNNFHVVDRQGVSNPRISIMAVPFIGGLNPDYSGLDFSEEAASAIMTSIEHSEIAPRHSGYRLAM